MDLDVWFAVQQLISRYSTVYDSRDIEPMGRLFTSDGVFESLPRRERSETFPFPARGRDEIIAALGARQAYWLAKVRRLHLTSNLLVHAHDGDTVRSSVQYAVIHTPHVGSPELFITGVYEDTIVRESDGEWRFAQRLAHREDTPTVTAEIRGS